MSLSPSLCPLKGSTTSGRGGNTACTGLIRGLILVCFGLLLSCLPAAAGVPVVATLPDSNVVPARAILYGNVSATGGAAVSEKGIVWANVKIPENQAPGARNIKVARGSGLGVFSATVQNLKPGSVIYYRAYAINADGYAYGEQLNVLPPLPLPLPVLNCGWSVVTCFSGAAVSGGSSSGYVMGYIDTNPVSLPNWGVVNNQPPTTAMYHHPNWTRARMGEVFGVTLDDQPKPNSFVSATAIYNSSHFWYFSQWPLNGTLGDTFGTWQQPGGIYCIDGTTGAVGNYALVPNAGLPASGTLSRANKPASLGNLHYDSQRRMIYVSNLDDGKIYKVTWQSTCPTTPLTATALFDHGMNGRPAGNTISDPGGPGITPAGRRVWAVHVWQDRLYYSVWNEAHAFGGTSLKNNANTEIWSVAFTPPSAGSPVTVDPATVRLEIGSIAPVDPVNFPDVGRTVPVSDMTISYTGAMMLSERGCVVAPADIFVPGSTSTHYILKDMIDTAAPHRANIFQYRRTTALSWVQDKPFSVGDFETNTNSAGGIDVDCDETVLVTGNALALSHGEAIGAWYGLQVIPSNVNPNGNGASLITNSHLIDYDTIPTVTAKNTPGDVALFKCPCPCFHIVNEQADCRGKTLRWTVTLTNTGGFDISHLYFNALTAGVTVLGPLSLDFTPPILAGETRTFSFDFNIPANPPAEFCFDIIAKNAELTLCCTQTFCIRPECCLRLAGETFTHVSGHTYDYCFTLTNLSGVTATKLILASNTCPVFINPIIALIPPMANGDTRSFCTRFVIPSFWLCWQLNFSVSLHDASYKTCCSRPRSFSWWQIHHLDLAPVGPGRLDPRVDFSDVLLQDISEITRVDYTVDGRVVASAAGPPRHILPAPLTLTPGTHKVGYIIHSAYGHQVIGPSSKVDVPAGLAAPNFPPAPLLLQMNVRSSDNAIVLSWDDPVVILEASTDLAGWEPVQGASSPYIYSDFTAKRRFFRLVPLLVPGREPAK